MNQPRSLNPLTTIRSAGFVILVLFSGSVACDEESRSPSTDDPPSQFESVADWLKDSAIPLDSVEPGSGFADLTPLENILKDVRIVGLGEATHGTREFFQLKHRLVEFLVEEMGFTVFGLEASYPGCARINDYVLHGKGNPEAALASQGFWIWDTEEIAELIEWMRSYNMKAPDGKKVKFVGFDFGVLDQSLEIVSDYLRRVAPDQVEKAEEAIKPLIDESRRIGDRAHSFVLHYIAGQPLPSRSTERKEPVLD